MLKLLVLLEKPFFFLLYKMMNCGERVMSSPFFSQFDFGGVCNPTWWPNCKINVRDTNIDVHTKRKQCFNGDSFLDSDDDDSHPPEPFPMGQGEAHGTVLRRGSRGIVQGGTYHQSLYEAKAGVKGNDRSFYLHCETVPTTFTHIWTRFVRVFVREMIFTFVVLMATSGGKLRVKIYRDSLLAFPRLDDGGLRYLLPEIPIHKHDWIAVWSPLLQVLLDRVSHN